MHKKKCCDSCTHSIISPLLGNSRSMVDIIISKRGCDSNGHGQNKIFYTFTLTANHANDYDLRHLLQLIKYHHITSSMLLAWWLVFAYVYCLCVCFDIWVASSYSDDSRTRTTATLLHNRYHLKQNQDF